MTSRSSGSSTVPQLVKLLIANDLGARRMPVELVEPTGFELGDGQGSSDD